jgi:transmembrane sensor
MQEKVEKIASLLDKYLKDELSAEDKPELENWLAEDEKNRLLFSEITDKEVLLKKLKQYTGVNSEAVWQQTLEKINTQQGRLVIMPRKRAWLKYVAAAVVAGLVVGSGFYFFNTSTKHNVDQPVAVTNTPSTGGDSTSSNRATLTLTDGKMIELKGNRTSIPTQGSMQASVTSEGLVYTKKPGTAGAEDQYNTVTTPVGSIYRVTLPDGSKVILNAASSLRFPIAFAGNERLVQLTGEAYFEVTSQKNQTGNTGLINPPKVPFIVTTAGSPDSKKECKIEVLGTHFNIMAYRDETSIQTTLVEGSVRVSKNDLIKIIKPGEQAVVTNRIIKVKKVDAEEVISWKDGYISGGNIYQVMRQVARWYNVEVSYEGNTPDSFVFDGTLDRNESIEVIIKVLEAYKIKARLEGRKLIITP